MDHCSQNPVNEERYYVRVRGRVQGPFDIARLRSLRSRGQLSRAFEVSENGRVWSSSADIPALRGLDGTKSLAEPPGAAATPSASQNAEATPILPLSTHPAHHSHVSPQGHSKTVGAILVGILLTVLIGGGVLVSLLELRLSSSSSEGTSSSGGTGPASNRSPTVGRTTAGTLTTLATRSVDTIDSITEPSAQTALNQAVGLVVCGVRVTLPNGTYKEIPESTGTCFVVSGQGYALTNRHVVEDLDRWQRTSSSRQTRAQEVSDALELPVQSIEPKVWLFFGGERCEATIEHISEQFDLAVLHAARPSSARFDLSAAAPNRGIRVYALGYPGAANHAVSEEAGVSELVLQHVALKADKTDVAISKLFQPHEFEFTLTDGLVSRIRAESDGLRHVQHNAAISPGNSGGPLTTSEGVVVGINTWVVTGAPDIYFALTTDQLRKEVDAHIPDAGWR